MKLLEDRILKEGRAVNEDILRVDTFINHQVDPELMMKCAREFASHYRGQGITKVVTMEYPLHFLRRWKWELIW